MATSSYVRARTVTIYDPVTGSGLDDGQPFPFLNAMERPVANSDGSTDIYATLAGTRPRHPGRSRRLFASAIPGTGRNWL
jgi:hypothetical protein